MALHSTLACAIVLSVCTVAYCHGFMSQPRMRGALNTQREVDPKVIDAGAPIDYCPHCLNAGGTGAVSKSPYTPYAPMDGNKRDSFGICGDKKGNDDHMKTGKYANPKSKPFAATYKSGSVANFEFDATTNHGGFLQFWLCDTSNNPKQDIQFSTFPKDCHYLKRVPKKSCEDGTDKGCGPIDKRDEGKWVIPCRTSEDDQIVGGKDGSMAYRIPDVKISVGVVHMYWGTRNSCTDDFMDKYNYPNSWSGCPGDGGSIGGKPQTTTKCSKDRVPEEFWNCADVKVTGGSGKVPPAKKPAVENNQAAAAEPEPLKKKNEQKAPEASKMTLETLKKPQAATTKSKPASKNIKEDGNCYPNWYLCQVGGKRCCKPGYVCAPYHNSPPLCGPPKGDISGEGQNSNSEDEQEASKDNETAKCRTKKST